MVPSQAFRCRSKAAWHDNGMRRPGARYEVLRSRTSSAWGSCPADQPRRLSAGFEGAGSVPMHPPQFHRLPGFHTTHSADIYTSLIRVYDSLLVHASPAQTFITPLKPDLSADPKPFTSNIEHPTYYVHPQYIYEPESNVETMPLTPTSKRSVPQNESPSFY